MWLGCTITSKVADGPKNQGTEKESLFAGIPSHLYHPCAAIDVDQFMNGTNGINDVHHIIYHVMVVIYHKIYHQYMLFTSKLTLVCFVVPQKMDTMI